MEKKIYLRPEIELENLLITNVINNDEGYEDTETDFEPISGFTY